ncbi:MAG: YncE family protein [Candidatus Glassbacteria bacterium]
MRETKILCELFLILVVISGCSGSRSGPIVYAGWNDIFAIDVSAGEIIAKIPVGTRINDLEPAEDGRLMAATANGLLIVDTDRMELSRTIPLGILDSVEYDAKRDLTYVLHHPGDDPNESQGPHKILKLSGSDYKELGSVLLEPWIYDTFLSPSGNHIYITQMAGRAVFRVSSDEFRKPERLWFGKGGKWEGRMVLLRHIAFSGDGSSMFVLEQGENDSTCIWNYSFKTEDKTRKCLESSAKVQGMVLSADGSRIFANGITELIILDSSGEEISRTRFDIEHRWIALSKDGNTVYLTAATGQEEGYITCVDTSGKVEHEWKFPTPLNVIAVERSL